MSASITDEITGLRDCAIGLLCGERLGRGATRSVYALKHSPDLVIKVEHASKEFCNVNEWEIWKAVQGHKNARWFAPVVDIDVWGGALIMKRTEPITEDEFRKVRELPTFFDDVHFANFGRLDGKIVCHDYGYHVLFEAVKSTRMRRVRHS